MFFEGEFYLFFFEYKFGGCVLVEVLFECVWVVGCVYDIDYVFEKIVLWVNML